MFKSIVAIRGGGDLATGIVQKLYRSGFNVVVLELENPMVIRREVAFAQAIYDKMKVVEGIKAVKINDTEDIKEAWKNKEIPVIIVERLDILDKIKSSKSFGRTLFVLPI